MVWLSAAFPGNLKDNSLLDEMGYQTETRYKQEGRECYAIKYSRDHNKCQNAGGEDRRAFLYLSARSYLPANCPHLVLHDPLYQNETPSDCQRLYGIGKRVGLIRPSHVGGSNQHDGYLPVACRLYKFM